MICLMYMLMQTKCLKMTLHAKQNTVYISNNTYQVFSKYEYNKEKAYPCLTVVI